MKERSDGHGLVEVVMVVNSHLLDSHLLDALKINDT